MTMDADLTCAQVRELLSACHDDELTAARSDAVARHLAICASCARELDTLRETSATVRHQLRPLTAPDLLRARVRSALRGAAVESAPRDATPARMAPWMRQLAAGLVIAVASSTVTVAVMRYPGTAPLPLAHEAVERHVRALMSSHVTDVASTDQHNVKPWFNGKVDFSPEVYRLEDAGFPLIGGRVDSLDGRAVAAIVYGRRKHVIDVFTWPASSGGSQRDQAAAAPAERGYNALAWSHAGMRFWAVSDLNVDELRQFVDAFRKAGGS